MEIIVEFIVSIIEIIVWVIYATFGATAGVLWPAKTPEWAKWQKWGIACGVIALICFVTAWVASRAANGSPATWPAMIIGFVALIGYCVIGNICRHYHEKR